MPVDPSQLSPEDLAYVKEHNIDLSQYDLLPQEDQGKLGAAKATAEAHAGSWLGGGLGAAGGTMLAAEILGAPETGGLSLIPAAASLAAPLLGGFGGAVAGDYAQRAVLPTDTEQRLQQQAAVAASQHPLVSAATDIAGGALLGGGKFSTTPLRMAGDELLARMAGNESADPQNIVALRNLVLGNAINVGGQTGLSAAQQLATTGTVDPGELAKGALEGAVGGTLFAQPSAYGSLITRGHWQSVEPTEHATAPEQSPVVANPDGTVQDYSDYQLGQMQAQHAAATSSLADVTARMQAAGQSAEAALKQQRVAQLGALLDPTQTSDKFIKRLFDKQFKQPVTGDVTDQLNATQQNAELAKMTPQQRREQLYNTELFNVDPDTARSHQEQLAQQQFADQQRQAEQAQQQTAQNEAWKAKSNQDLADQQAAEAAAEKQRADDFEKARAEQVSQQVDQAEEQRTQQAEDEARKQLSITQNQARIINPESMLPSAVARPEVTPAATVHPNEAPFEPGRTATDEIQDRLEQSGAKYQSADVDDELDHTPTAPDGIRTPQLVEQTPAMADIYARGKARIGAVQGEIPTPGGGKAYGAFNPALRSNGHDLIQLIQSRLPTTDAHEYVHKFTEDLRRSPLPWAKQLLAGMRAETEPNVEALAGKLSKQAESLHDAGRVARMKQWLNDVWSNMRVKLGVATHDDYDNVAMRVMRQQHPEGALQASLPEGAIPSKGGVKHQPANQPSDDHSPSLPTNA